MMKPIYLMCLAVLLPMLLDILYPSGRLPPWLVLVIVVPILIWLLKRMMFGFLDFIFRNEIREWELQNSMQGIKKT